MKSSFNQMVERFDPRFKIFHELMRIKVREVLLVSTPYDAWIMEEDCRLSEAIVHEYRGLNLSHPPRFHWVSSAEAALSALSEKPFDLVIVMPQAALCHRSDLAGRVREKAPGLPVILLCHRTPEVLEHFPSMETGAPYDRTFLWTGNSNLLLAVIKSLEDQMNVDPDTDLAGIRVIIFVEDSPEYVSVLLPLLYRELVIQTQAVIGEGLNEDHRLLAMRARPKILLAGTYEQAMALFNRYEACVLGVISDVRFPRHRQLDGNAGIDLLSTIQARRFDIPLLLISSEPRNAEKATAIPAVFLDKNAPSLLSDVRSFLRDHLGFGPFVFSMPDGRRLGHADSLRMLEKKLHDLPEPSFVHHCNRNDFSRWLFARGEIELASMVRPVRDSDFSDVESHRRYLIDLIHRRRMNRQKGVVGNFDPKAFDTDAEFLKIGNGSLGGKARGLAFMSAWLHRHAGLQETFRDVHILVPQTLVITTECFERFIDANHLGALAKEELPNEVVARRFMAADFPEDVREQLGFFLSRIHFPLAVRSSSLLEDAQFRAYAGLYKTYMLPNDHPDPGCRLNQLVNAVKLIYASTYFEDPKAFSRRVGNRIEEEKMGIIIQRLIGNRCGAFFYPAVSGVAQSHNYYPFSRMTPDDGIATIALGLGKAVMEGERNLRFSPRYPQLLPQRSTVDDILNHSQRHFYAVRLGESACHLWINDGVTLARREVDDAGDEPAVRSLASTYIPEEHRIRDSAAMPGCRVVTFAPLLKYNSFPLAPLLKATLDIGREGMGCPVEMEFSAELNPPDGGKPQFAVLQLRPMSARESQMDVEISPEEIDSAFCVSHQALGNTVSKEMVDIVYVRPDVFDPARTVDIAREIGRMNALLAKQGRKYLLMGPGRWGSADPWLGIPVQWADICGVGAIVETLHERIQAEPSQGSHFFHNITTLGINYLNVTRRPEDRVDWSWINALHRTDETPFVVHAETGRPITLKVDGRKTLGVLLRT